MVQGDYLEFVENPPVKHKAYSPTFSTEEKTVISSKIEKLLSKGVIKVSNHEQIEYVSPIFLTPKSDGEYRMILNLRTLNQFIKYEHFKMDNIKTVLHLIKPKCYMCKIDLKDAYYSIKIEDLCQKYLKFQWEEVLYQYTCYPNGLCSCPRRFTKLMKVPLCILRIQGCEICGYIDDFIIIATTYLKCFSSTRQAVDLFTRLGFLVHTKKSIVNPAQSIEFLGFVINSVIMSIELTITKKVALKKLVNQLLQIKRPKIRFLAKVIVLWSRHSQHQNMVNFIIGN